MKLVKFKGKDISIDEFLTKILGEVPAEKIKITIAELKDFACNKDIFVDKNLEDFKKIVTVEDLTAFISNTTTQNLGVKTLLEVCFDAKKIAFYKNALKSCGKNNIKVIFDNLFDFSEDTLPVSSAQTSEENSAPPPTSATTPAPVKVDLTIERMQKILDSCQSFTTRDDVDVTQFELTERMPVTLLNDFYMIVPPHLKIYQGAMAIVSTQGTLRKIACVGSLRQHEGKTHILIETQDIDYNLFREQNYFNVVLFPEAAQEFFENGEIYSGEIYLVECIVDLKQPQIAQSTLCIDFGTSNTTVGSYGIKNPSLSEPEIVDFLDDTGKLPERKKMLPTVVYIESLSNNKVKYLFGYEALKKVIEKDYNPTASVFYEIKRWINNINATEIVTDEQGHKVELSHKEIIRAYLEHVLELAEQYFERRFTKLHFTAPVKLKESFIEEMRKMFNEKNRSVNDAAHSIDEGIAIIYNHVSDQIKNRATDISDEPERVLIMDCGGGTTDLASCEYSLDTKGYSKNLNIITRFENGDSNFGGNNVTFRILQLLKIKLAHKLQGKECSVQKLIDDENKILSAIDNKHDKSYAHSDEITPVYDKFDKEYELAEKFVPTKFGAEKLLQKRSKLKRNFYYLWQMAEAYKIQFYRASMDFVSVNFNNPDDRKIGIPDDNKYYLYVKATADSELERLTNPMSGIEVTNNDIHRLLYADIYDLLKTVLHTYDVNDNEQELLKYRYYKLSGQSCKITLFTELLKEFVPGKYLRYDNDKISSPDSIELKLACIKGSIYYVRDTEYGEIKPKITMQAPQLIYNVYKVAVDGENEKPMLESGKIPLRPTVDKISSEAQRVKYVVEALTGKRQNTVDFVIEKKGGRAITTTEIKLSIANLTHDETGELREFIEDELTSIDLSKERDKKVFALFLVPSKSGYGFYIYCLRVEDGADRYHLTCEPKYVGFENNALETFFDGSR